MDQGKSGHDFEGDGILVPEASPKDTQVPGGAGGNRISIDPKRKSQEQGIRPDEFPGIMFGFGENR